MVRGSAAVLCLLLALSACRGYDYRDRLTESGGLVPPDQMARYGQEQAQAVAIGRAFAAAYSGDSPQALQARADSALRYARTLPGVVNAVADPLTHRLTAEFRSGWIDGIIPIDDGTPPAETPNLPGARTP